MAVGGDVRRGSWLPNKTLPRAPAASSDERAAGAIYHEDLAAQLDAAAAALGAADDLSLIHISEPTRPY